MEQKITWMRYLIFGIKFLALATFINCGDKIEDCVVKSDFKYINETNYLIETSIGNIPPNDKLIISDESIGQCGVVPSNYVPPFIGNTIIKFNGELCLTYASISVGVGDGPVGIKNYENTKLSDNYYEFTYYFTEAEYNQAEDCN